MSFPRYPRYKDSRVPWLGDVPEHWTVCHSRRMFRVRDEPAHDSDQHLTASQKHGMIPQAEFVALEGRRVVEVMQWKEKLLHVEPDDFVMTLRSFEGGIEWSRLRGSAGYSYVILTPVKNVLPRFFGYLFKSAIYIQALRTTTDLVRDGQALRFSHFVQVPLPVVPQDEQAAIAAFLDRETAKIDALVAEQERLIELLKEKRQAVISHAVTKGLNPTAPMKDSGVEWLGQVPAHWGVARCGRYLTLLSGFAFPSTGFSSERSLPKLLRGVNVGVGALRWDDVVYWPRATGDGLDAYVLKVGDLVIGMDRPLIAEGMRVAEVRPDDLPCLLLQRVACLRSRGPLRLRYLKLLLASPMFVAHFSPETTGVSVPHISPEQITNFVIPMPPVAEQDEVVDRVDSLVAQSTALVAEAQRGIDLLLERRAALISAAVTGQIDVRPESMRTAA